MQIKTDFTKDELLAGCNAMLEACHPLEKLKAIANLLYAYPDGPFEIEGDTLISVSEMIMDAANEIDYLIDIADEQWRRDREKWRSNHA